MNTPFVCSVCLSSARCPRTATSALRLTKPPSGYCQKKHDQRFQAVLKLKPNDAAALTGLAEVALLPPDADDKRAEQLCSKALAEDAGCYAAVSIMGLVHAARGEFQKAEVLQRDAAAADPSSAEFSLRLGVALWSQGGASRRDSLKVFIRTAQLDAHCHAAFTYLGHHYAAGGKKTVGRAIKCYEKAVALEPLNSDAGECLFGLYANAGRTDDVVTLCKRATEAAFGYHVQEMKWAWLGLGRALLLKGSNAAAVEALQSAARVASADPQVWLVLGNGYQARGSYVRSDFAPRHARARGPTCLAWFLGHSVRLHGSESH